MEKLSVREKAGYGIGEIASNIVWMTVMFFLAIFYTDTFGIPASVVGTMFIIVRLFDGINDPIMGIIADRTTTRWGKYRPYILWMAVPFGIGGILMFITPDFNLTGKIIYAYSTYIFMMIIYTAIMIPFSALSGVMTSNADDRTSLNSYRFIGAFVGGLFIQGLALYMVGTFGQDNESIVRTELLNDKIIIHEANTGNVKIKLSAIDELGREGFDEFSVKVSKDGENPPYVLESIKDTVVKKGFGSIHYDLKKYFHDFDGESLLYSVNQSGKAVSAEIKGSQLILDENFPGNSIIRLTASDAIEGQANINFEIFVNEIGNRIPQINKPLPDLKFNIETNKSYLNISNLIGIKETEIIDASDLFTDPDMDDIIINAESSNDEIFSVKADKKIIKIKKKLPGKADLTVTANDGKGGMEKTKISITLATENGSLPPYRISKIEDFRVPAGFGNREIKLGNIFASATPLKYNLVVINSAKGYQITMMIFGLFCIALFLITFFSTKERVQPISGEKSKLKDDFKDLIRNIPWVILFLVSLTTMVYVGLRSAVIAYYFEYYVGDSSLTAAFLVIGSIVIIISLTFTKWLTKIFEKRILYVICMLVVGLSVLGFSFLDSDDIFMIFLLQIIQSLGSGPTMPLLWSMLADSADYNEWKTGRKAMGLAYSASTFAQKAGIAFGGALAMWLLAGYGYQANIEQTETALNGMKLMIGAYPAMGAFICALLIWFYGLDRNKMQLIEKELNGRRKLNQ